MFFWHVSTIKSYYGSEFVSAACGRMRAELIGSWLEEAGGLEKGHTLFTLSHPSPCVWAKKPFSFSSNLQRRTTSVPFSLQINRAGIVLLDILDIFLPYCKLFYDSSFIVEARFCSPEKKTLRTFYFLHILYELSNLSQTSAFSEIWLSSLLWLLISEFCRNSILRLISEFLLVISEVWLTI